MAESKIEGQNGIHDHYFDALDTLPPSDLKLVSEWEESHCTLSSLSSNLRRRRSTKFNRRQITAADSNKSIFDSSPISEITPLSDAISASPKERRNQILSSLKDHSGSESLKYEPNSDRILPQKEPNSDPIDKPAASDTHLEDVDEFLANFLVSVAGLVIKDFKLFYDAKFGRKWVTEDQDGLVLQTDQRSVENGYASNGNGNFKSTPDMAIFEQFQHQGRNGYTQLPGASLGRTEEKPPRSLLPAFESAEMRTLAESLSRDIIRGSPDVKWESIKGLENAKRLLKEAVVMPIKYPKYFTGLLSPWKGILLFGPPGTGKTMLAKAVATECKTTFFNISASSVVSKWRGDSEKLVRVLFELARHHAPSTIFLDEIDAIISQRGEGRTEHEASRRLKTELLIQMDGLTRTDELVFVLAATNLPWELDSAMLRRLEKRILVPLPEPEARRAMFEELLPSIRGEYELPYDLLVEKTEGYSGSDIRLVCKEAAMQPLRRLMAHLEDKEEVVPEEELPQIGPVTREDIETALRNTRPSAHLHAHRYDKFNSDYGSQNLR